MTRRLQASSIVDDFNDHPICSYVHATSRALVSDKTTITSAVSVRHRAGERLANRAPPVVVQVLGGDKNGLHSQSPQVSPLVACVLTEKGDGARIAKDAPTALAFYLIKIPRHSGGVHLKGREQPRAQNSIAQFSQTLLLAQFHGRTPDGKFRVGDSGAKPAFSAHACSNVAADSSRSKQEDQRRPGRTSSGKSAHPARILAL